MNLLEFFAIIIIALAGSLLLLLISQRYRYPLVAVYSWWVFWLFVSMQSWTGLYVPSFEVYLLYFAALICSILGGVLFGTYGGLKGAKYGRALSEKVNLFWVIVFGASLLVVAVVSVRGGLILFTMDSLVGYRLALFSSGGEGGLLFASSRYQSLYTVVVLPVVKSGLFIGVSYFVLLRKTWLLAVAFIALSLSSIVMLGRTFIYLSGLIVVLLSFWPKNNAFEKKWALLIPAILAGLVVAVSYGRSGGGLLWYVSNYFVDYHTLGFSLFFVDYVESSSLLNVGAVNPFSSFGYAENVVVAILHMLGYDSLDSSAAMSAQWLNEFRVLREDGTKYNAYGTAVYPVYMDGGWVYVLVCFFLYGLFLVYCARMVYFQSSVKHMALLILLVWTGLSGLFSPPLSGGFWLELLWISIAFVRVPYLLRRTESDYTKVSRFW